jgi:hypothetical protein
VEDDRCRYLLEAGDRRLINHSSIGAIAVSARGASAPESRHPGQHHQGGGAQQVDRRGKTRAHIGLTETQIISRSAPSDESGSGTSPRSAITRHAERGVFRSKDGGATWEKICSATTRPA